MSRIVLACLISCALGTSSFAAQEQAKPKIIGIGIMADGKRVIVLQGQKVPWAADVLSRVMPDLHEARWQRTEGLGWFHLVLDLKTGRIRDMGIVKSTGSKVLDESAINSLRYWRWRPGKWKELYVAVDFFRVR